MKRFGRFFSRFVLLIALCIGFSLIGLSEAIAQPSLTEISISLGNESGQLQFFPNHLQLKAHQKYKLILTNPSPSKHYFTAKDFADASWTQKVQAGKVEVKGAIHELELKPGGAADWVLVPQRAGLYDLYCSVPGHREAGMIGKIIID
jgi:uncharacterized cupredoxin-like copper-binding protein